VSGLLTGAEQRAAARQLTLAMVALGLVGLGLLWQLRAPGQSGVSQLLLGAACLLVAPPVVRAGWYSLRSPSLPGITDQLIALASADIVLIGSDLRRLGTCIRLSRQCRHTLQVNVGIGLGWTLAIVACAAGGLLGAAGAMIAAMLHNLSTLLVLGNAGRLLQFHETLPRLDHV
jgi:hypothetical protein